MEMDLLVSYDELGEYIAGRKRCNGYDLKNYITNEILTHSDTNVRLISNLLSNKYPSEPDYILKYRINNFSAITSTYFTKVVNTLIKIDRAEDFVIKYNGNTRVRDYCENEIRNYKSIRNWFFSVGLKAMLTHPNGLMCVFPEYIYTDTYQDSNSIINEDHYIAPQLYVYKTENVYEINDDWALVKDDADGCYYYFDRNVVVRITVEDAKSEGKEVYSGIGSAKKDLVLTIVSDHQSGILPVFTFGGIPFDVEKTDIYESFISGVVPFWNQALIEYSDKQAGIKQHLFPEKWRIMTEVCPDCKGTGSVSYSEIRGERKAFCKTCNGSGDPPTGMFSEVRITKDTILDGKTPIPPIGYVEKSFEAIEYLDKDIYQNIYAGLAAINMEFIAETPLNQSGVAKEFDRQELNAFIYQVARHIVNNVLNPIYERVISQLYAGVDFDLNKLMPDIGIPVHYDFTTAKEAEERYSVAKNAGVSSSILAQLEKKYIEKAFENFKDEKNYLLLINKLDPIPQKSVEDKISMLDSEAVTYQDYVCSTNIDVIIRECMNTYSGFYNYDYMKQKKLMYEITDKLINQIDIDNEQEITAVPESVQPQDGNGGIFE